MTLADNRRVPLSEIDVSSGKQTLSERHPVRRPVTGCRQELLDREQALLWLRVHTSEWAPRFTGHDSSKRCHYPRRAISSGKKSMRSGRLVCVDSEPKHFHARD
jgi:hypothetical protein